MTRDDLRIYESADGDPVDPALLARLRQTAVAAGERFFAEWDESQHPRDDHGEFSAGGGAGLASVLEKASQPDGGFTYQPVTGDQPREGFVVSVYKGREAVYDVKTLTLDDLWAYAKANWDLLQQPGNYFGGWHNPDDGKLYLDVSKVVHDRAEAERIGRDAHQLAIFDLKEGRSYPLAERYTTRYGHEAGAVSHGPASGRPDPRGSRGTVSEADGAGPVAGAAGEAPRGAPRAHDQTPHRLADWDESQHPRADDGQFTNGAGGETATPAADPPHLAQLKKEAAEGRAALEKLLPEAIKDADYKAAEPTWRDLESQVQEDVYRTYIDEFGQTDAGEEAAANAEKEYLSEHVNADVVFDQSLDQFLKDAAEDGIKLDPESVVQRVYDKVLTADVNLPTLRKADGSALTSAEMAVVSKLHDDVVESTREKLEGEASESIQYQEYVDENVGDAAQEAWRGQSDESRMDFAVSHDFAVNVDEDGPPNKWVWADPEGFAAAGRPGVDYLKTRAIALALVEKRTDQLLNERGLKGPGHYKVDAEEIAGEAWESWKESSTSDVGLAMQLAATKELGAVDRLSDSQREDAIQAAAMTFTHADERTGELVTIDEKMRTLGMGRLQAYTRAQWETTQFVLDKAGVDKFDTYRAIMLPLGQVAAEKTEKVEIQNNSLSGPVPYTRFTEVALKRNGLASTTLKPTVANAWHGVGPVSRGAGMQRVVLRFRAPKEAAFSVPVFGRNIQEEQELVMLGNRDGVKWDAWLQQAPPVNEKSHPLREVFDA